MPARTVASLKQDLGPALAGSSFHCSKVSKAAAPPSLRLYRKSCVGYIEYSEADEQPKAGSKFS